VLGLVAVGWCAAVAACAGPFGLSDGSSLSVWSHGNGYLVRGVALSERGDGYVVPSTWQQRGRRYGTRQLVEAIVRVARKVSRHRRGALLGVADLSDQGGGPALPEHGSHRNGRDVDLLFYTMDTRGRPLPPMDVMTRFTPSGVAIVPAHAPRPPSGAPKGRSPGREKGRVASYGGERRFDDRANWALVRALVLDERVAVQAIFIHRALRQRLLDWATQSHEDPAVIAAAAEVMRQPSDAAPHDDHLHVRVLCAPEDRFYGCVDRGALRWWKKGYKYLEDEQRGAALGAVAARSAEPPMR
jgi:penicillin-insensitive murein endopeptidase